MSAPATISNKERILGGLWGSLVGDALDVTARYGEVELLFNRFETIVPKFR
jgi:hypothetical protein